MIRESDRIKSKLMALHLRLAELRSEAEKIPYRVVETLGMDVSELEALHAALTRVIDATA